MKSKMLSELRHFDRTMRGTSFSNYRKFLRVVLRSLDTDWSSDALRFLRAKDYSSLYQLAELLVEQQYSTAKDHFLASQFAALVRKYPWPTGSLNFDPEAKALETFKASERYCSRVNKRFRVYLTGRKSGKVLPSVSNLSRARDWIYRLLGTSVPLKKIYHHCDFGPGASVGVHGNSTNLARKLLAKQWSVSPGTFYYARSAMISNPHIFRYLVPRHRGDIYGSVFNDNLQFNCEYNQRVAVVEYNKISFVPKTAKTFRTIAVEPLLNGFVQKGIDTVLRKRLYRFGIDLSDQSVNQRKAREGSLSGQADPYVTIDLSSASDSISIGFVRYMLPPDWFDFLNSVRSTHYLLNGSTYRYSKFVSMGNGFCFPLETLLFASLCAAVYDELGLKHDFSVYGDDIVIRQSAATKVLALLKLSGFRVNSKKSFVSGPFRESCGADWYEGKDVRPVTLDYSFDSLDSIFKFSNIARSKEATAIFLNEGLDYLKSLIPPSLLFTRPYKGVVDSALEVPFDSFLSSKFAKWDSHLFSWSWLELVRESVPDKQVRSWKGYHIALTIGALRGSTSRIPFAERRNTRTKIRRLAYSGANSTFVPAQG